MASVGQVNLAGRLFDAVLTMSVVCGLTFATIIPAFAAYEFLTIHTFQGGTDGEFPEAGLAVDVANDKGTMYGTTFGSLSVPGKSCSKGCQYDFVGGNLTSDHYFQAGNDGAFPTGEVFVQNGAIYGSTELGGGTACGGLGCGTVFLFMVGRSENVFEFCSFDFPNCTNGALPYAGPIVDSAGNAYGTTTLGGTANGYQCDSNFRGCGTVYMLTPGLSTESVLYSFCSLSACQDGAVPLGKLLRDDAGNLYGTTQFGGDYGAGTIFKLAPDGTETVLHAFSGPTDGAIPEAGLIADDAGNLYGTASAGGKGKCKGSSPGCGVVFKLAPDRTYKVLHYFRGGRDGALPQAPLVADSTGNLYGTTQKGGYGKYCKNRAVGCGTVFMLAADGTETRLHVFGATDKSKSDGAQPEGALLLNNGYLYGAARVGGKSTSKCDCGTLFQISIPTGTSTAWTRELSRR